MNWLTLLPLLIKYGPLVKAIWDEASSNEDAVAKIRALSAPLADAIEGIGAALFPNIAPTLHTVGGIVSTFDPNVTAWMQKGLNKYLALNPPLVVDGIYGKKTIAAIQQAEQKLGLNPTGLADQTLQAILAKVFV